jgi:F-type H+-transporting ATPase subunit delta
VSKHSSNHSVVVKRYAEALYSCAKTKKDIDQLTSDVTGFSELLGANEDLSKMISSPVISVSEKQNALEKIAGKMKVGKLFANFLNVLAQNSRLALLENICDQAVRLAKSLSGQQEAVVTSTYKLTKKDMDQIAKTVSKETGQDVVLTNEIDETILGGMKLRIGSVMIDDSVKTHIDKLGRALTKREIFETHLTQNLKEVG